MKSGFNFCLWDFLTRSLIWRMTSALLTISTLQATPPSLVAFSSQSKHHDSDLSRLILETPPKPGSYTLRRGDTVVGTLTYDLQGHLKLHVEESISLDLSIPFHTASIESTHHLYLNKILPEFRSLHLNGHDLTLPPHLTLNSQKSLHLKAQHHLITAGTLQGPHLYLTAPLITNNGTLEGFSSLTCVGALTNQGHLQAGSSSPLSEGFIYLQGECHNRGTLQASKKVCLTGLSNQGWIEAPELWAATPLLITSQGHIGCSTLTNIRFHISQGTLTLTPQPGDTTPLKLSLWGNQGGILILNHALNLVDLESQGCLAGQLMSRGNLTLQSWSPSGIVKLQGIIAAEGSLVFKPLYGQPVTYHTDKTSKIFAGQAITLAHPRQQWIHEGQVLKTPGSLIAIMPKIHIENLLQAGTSAYIKSRTLSLRGLTRSPTLQITTDTLHQHPEATLQADYLTVEGKKSLYEGCVQALTATLKSQTFTQTSSSHIQTHQRCTVQTCEATLAGRLTSSEGLTLNAQQTLDITQAHLTSQTLTLCADTLEMGERDSLAKSSETLQADQAHITVGQHPHGSQDFINVMAAQKGCKHLSASLRHQACDLPISLTVDHPDIAFEFSDVTLRDSLESTGNLRLVATTSFTQTAGHLSSAGNLHIRAPRQHHQGTLRSGAHLQIDAQTLTSHKATYQADTLTQQTTESLSHTNSSLQAQKTLELQAAGKLTLTSSTLASGDDMLIEGQQDIKLGASSSISSSSTSHRSGFLDLGRTTTHKQHLHVDPTTLNSQGSLVVISSKGSLTTEASALQASGDMVLQGEQGVNLNSLVRSVDTHQVKRGLFRSKTTVTTTQEAVPSTLHSGGTLQIISPDQVTSQGSHVRAPHIRLDGHSGISFKGIPLTLKRHTHTEGLGLNLLGYNTHSGTFEGFTPSVGLTHTLTTTSQHTSWHQTGGLHCDSLTVTSPQGFVEFYDTALQGFYKPSTALFTLNAPQITLGSTPQHTHYESHQQRVSLSLNEQQVPTLSLYQQYHAQDEALVVPLEWSIDHLTTLSTNTHLTLSGIRATVAALTGQPLESHLKHITSTFSQRGFGRGIDISFIGGKPVPTGLHLSGCGGGSATHVDAQKKPLTSLTLPSLGSEGTAPYRCYATYSPIYDTRWAAAISLGLTPATGNKGGVAPTGFDLHLQKGDKGFTFSSSMVQPAKGNHWLSQGLDTVSKTAQWTRTGAQMLQITGALSDTTLVDKASKVASWANQAKGLAETSAGDRLANSLVLKFSEATCVKALNTLRDPSDTRSMAHWMADEGVFMTWKGLSNPDVAKLVHSSAGGFTYALRQTPLSAATLDTLSDFLGVTSLAMVIHEAEGSHMITLARTSQGWYLQDGDFVTPMPLTFCPQHATLMAMNTRLSHQGGRDDLPATLVGKIPPSYEVLAKVREHLDPRKKEDFKPYEKKALEERALFDSWVETQGQAAAEERADKEFVTSRDDLYYFLGVDESAATRRAQKALIKEWQNCEDSWERVTKLEGITLKDLPRAAVYGTGSLINYLGEGVTRGNTWLRDHVELYDAAAQPIAKGLSDLGDFSHDLKETLSHAAGQAVWTMTENTSYAQNAHDVTTFSLATGETILVSKGGMLAARGLGQGVAAVRTSRNVQALDLAPAPTKSRRLPPQKDLSRSDFDHIRKSSDNFKAPLSPGTVSKARGFTGRHLDELFSTTSERTIAKGQLAEIRGRAVAEAAGMKVYNVKIAGNHGVDFVAIKPHPKGGAPDIYFGESKYRGDGKFSTSTLSRTQDRPGKPGFQQGSKAWVDHHVDLIRQNHPEVFEKFSETFTNNPERVHIRVNVLTKQGRQRWYKLRTYKELADMPPELHSKAVIKTQPLTPSPERNPS